MSNKGRQLTAVTPVIMFLMCVVTVRRHAFCLRLPNHMSTLICERGRARAAARWH